MDRRTFLLLSGAFLVACGRDPALVVPDGVVADPNSTFHAIYDDPALAARFADFLENVFHLYPEDRFQALISQATQSHPGDEAIYRRIAKELPSITPVGSMLTHALPALAKQKEAMSEQMASLLPGKVDGYLEIGTPGRYVRSLKRKVAIEGPVWVVHTDKPSKDITDIVERGQLPEVGTWVPLGNYDPIGSDVPDNSVDAVSNLIGFHHAPDDRLDGFITGVRRVLRPGGRLVLREHDVTDATMRHIVTLAHDVFNVGTALTWADNQAEIRRFRSVAAWTTHLQGLGFRRLEGAVLQDGDPTANTLIAFEKV